MRKLLLLMVLVKSVILWSNHNISTLKLLQVVHRHGDRTPITFLPNDPFKNATKYWPEGIGQLTREGKLRMFRIGQFIRREYQEFLGNEYSPLEVYVRSSIASRCLQSVAMVLAGAYPPNNKKWQWNNGSETELGLNWQPFPIESFMPKIEDIVLTTNENCPKVDEEIEHILKSEKVMKILEENKEFLTELSKTVGIDVGLKEAKTLFSDLSIEHSRGLKWSDTGIWSPEYEDQVYNRLKPLAELQWSLVWDNDLIERVRAGPLIKELIKNFVSYIENKPIENFVGKPYKLFVYSTHDTKLAALMNALNIFNKQLIPFGATLLFELHQSPDSGDYFVKIYYHNQTLTNADPYSMTYQNCGHEKCRFDYFHNNSTKMLLIDDWNNECNIRSDGKSISNNQILLIITLFYTIRSVYN